MVAAAEAPAWDTGRLFYRGACPVCGNVYMLTPEKELIKSNDVDWVSSFEL